MYTRAAAATHAPSRIRRAQLHPRPQVIPADREDATDALVVTYLSTVEPLRLRRARSAR